MDTQEHLASLDGQQYLVLRPAGAVARAYEEVQGALLAGDAGGLPHPHTGHVTLRGFFEPHRREELAALIRTWAADRRPIALAADAVDSFAAPWQIVILRLARTAALVDAYASLTDALAGSDFRRLGELPLDEWTFHLSVVYAKTLRPEAWDRLEAAAVRPLDPSPAETVDAVEFVWYENGEEYAETIPLGGIS